MTVFYNKDGQAVERTPCEIYARVMGYIRNVSNYNTGKRSEFYSRKYFSEKIAMDRLSEDNQKFMRKYGN